MTFKSPSQPFCRTCGTPIRRQTRTVWIENDPGAMMSDSKFTRKILCDPPPADIHACQALTNWKVTSVRRSQHKAGRPIWAFNEWDGESYADEFFCKNDCAIAMGMAAASTGSASAKWRAAVEKAKKTATPC